MSDLDRALSCVLAVSLHIRPLVNNCNLKALFLDQRFRERTRLSSLYSSIFTALLFIARATQLSEYITNGRHIFQIISTPQISPFLEFHVTFLLLSFHLSNPQIGPLLELHVTLLITFTSAKLSIPSRSGQGVPASIAAF